MMTHQLRFLICSLAIASLAGCPKANAPLGPPLKMDPKQPASAATAAPQVRFAFNEDVPGVMTFDEFSRKYEHHPVDDSGRDKFSANEVGSGSYVVEASAGLTFASLPVKDATYVFHNGTLGAVAIDVVDPTDLVTGELTSKYGEPTSIENGNVTWLNDLGRIRMKRSPEGTLVYWGDTAVSREWMEARSTKAAAERNDAKATAADIGPRSNDE